MASNAKVSILKPCGTGDEKKLREILTASVRNINIDEIDAQGAGALHRAARQGHVGIIQILLERRASIDARDRKMITPLHEACAAGHAACVKTLLDAGAHPNLHKTNSSVTNGGFSPLHFAAANGHVECVEHLLAASADVRGGDRAGECPLHVAVRNGSMAMVGRLLAEGLEPWIFSHNGRTPLHVAALHGRVECAKALLEAAAATAPTSPRQETAAAASDLAATEAASRTGGELKLLHKGDCGAACALHEAAAGGHCGTIELLLSRNAMVDAEDVHGRTPLLCAAAEGHLDAVRLLLDRGASKQKEHKDVAATLEGRSEPESHSFLHQAILKVSPVGRHILEELERKHANPEPEPASAGDVRSGKQKRKERRRLARQQHQQEDASQTEAGPELTEQSPLSEAES